MKDPAAQRPIKASIKLDFETHLAAMNAAKSERLSLTEWVVSLVKDKLRKLSKQGRAA